MSEVKRFAPNPIPGHPPPVVVDSNGLYCLYGELDIERIAHAKTQKRLEELEDAVHDKMNWLPGKYSIGRQMQLDRIYAEAEKSSRGRE